MADRFDPNPRQAMLMDPAPMGQYVRYSDLAAAHSAIKRLVERRAADHAEIERLKHLCDDHASNLIKADAEIERLTKQRDHWKMVSGVRARHVTAVRQMRLRAEKAEAERDEARAQVAVAYELAADHCWNKRDLLADAEKKQIASGLTGRDYYGRRLEAELLSRSIRALTPADAQSALEAYGREKVREGMQKAADIAQAPDEDDDLLDRQCRIIVAAQILAEIEKEGGE